MPEILIAFLALLILVLDWWLPKDRKYMLGYMSALGIVVIYFIFHVSTQTKLIPDAANVYFSLSDKEQFFQGFVVDGFSFFFKKLFLITALAVVIFSIVFFEKQGENLAEYYALLLFSVLGCFLLVGASDLLTLFLSFELMSIPLYILSGYLKHDSRSSEAGLKYFLVGAVTSALLVYGISLVYFSMGTTDLRHLTSPGPVTMTRLAQDHILLIGLVFMLSAFAFKIAAVPFHMWAPDVYEGAPAPVVAFLAVAPKIAVIGLLLRIFTTGMPEAMGLWSWLFALAGALSMTFGNLMALHQQNLKRLLAYSGISQMGYILVGLAAIGPVSLANPPYLQLAYHAVLFYVAAYLFSDLAAFGIVTTLSAHGLETIHACRGLASKHPPLALAFLVSLFSLAGIPPLVGFVGKFYLFAAAFGAKMYWLVFLGVLNSVVSLYYYLQVAKAMYFHKEVGEPLGKTLTEPSLPLRMTLLATGLAIVIVGIFPRLIADGVQTALQRFLSTF